MKKLTSKALILCATVMALAACNPTDIETITVTGDYMNGATAKTTYSAYIGTLFDSLDYHVTQEANNSQHIANFLDGLVTNDPYGRLVKSLATKVEARNNYTQFLFTIRENVPWVTYNGEQYVNRNGEPQFVKAEDWVTTAKRVLDYATLSDTSFMVTMFIEGTKEYQAYTYVQYLIATNPDKANELRRPQAQAKEMEAYIFENFNKSITINPDNLDRIASFEDVGIRVGSVEAGDSAEDVGKLIFDLEEPANFFPTMLTYSPFLPTNADFLAQHQNDFGVGNDGILYCGPYTLQTSSDDQIIYKRNPLYWNIDDVHVETVNYHVISADADRTTARIAFENGEIDGFTLDSKDTDGWNKYVAGPNNTGTLQDPYDPVVNSRFYDNISYTWFMSLNINRESALDGGTSAATQRSELTDAEIENTNKALSIREVRELLFRSLDFSVYNRRHGSLLEEQQQVQLNTLVPENFAFDDQQVDYTDYYYEEYAERTGITTDQAREKLGPGQYDGVNLTFDEITPIRENAIKAVELYNQEHADDPITLPIKVEQLSLGGFDLESALQDVTWTNSLNERANGCTVNQTAGLPSCSGTDYPFLVVINNENFTSQDNWSQAANASWGHLNVWGWQADYGDPLSYLNIFTTGGDMAFVTGTDHAVPGYELSADGNSLVHFDNVLSEYDEVVHNGREQYQDYDLRFTYFAEAEYMLLNELFIMLPLYNQGQGWRASISNAIGYESPSAGYGLSTDRLTGMWVLLAPPSGEQRAEMVALFEQKEAAAIEESGGMIAIYD